MSSATQLLRFDQKPLYKIQRFANALKNIKWLIERKRLMDIRKIANEIDLLEKQVQSRTQSYMMDPNCTDVIDSQLNGHIKAVHTYCIINNLNTFADSINFYFPVERTAIEFFCLWDGLKTDIIEHSESLQGRMRQRTIYSIACVLQSSMTKDSIDAYLGGFAVPLSDTNYTINSKRVYVENTLKNVDGITIMNIAKDLHLISPDVLSTNIEDLSSSEFISQQISKFKAKMNTEDFDGAITNARTLVEEILLCIEEKIQGSRQAYDGNLPGLYKRVSKQINMYPDDSKTGNSFNEILRGFISIISGLAGLSNNIADRHATAKHPKKHHAKIVVNSAMILSEFLLESFDYQQSK